jgi:hypothetical protein
LRDLLKRDERNQAALAIYLNRHETLTEQFAQHNQQLESESAVENYLKSEGYHWQYRKLTIGYLKNFLMNKKIQFGLGKKREFYLQLAKDYINKNPEPQTLSVELENGTFVVTSTGSNQVQVDNLLPEYVSAAEKPYQTQQKVTVAQ